MAKRFAIIVENPGASRLVGFGLVSFALDIKSHSQEEQTEVKTKYVAAVWGTKLIQFLAALAIFLQNDLTKRMNRITATWRNGCFGKMDDHPVHTIPNRHPTKMDVLPKTIVQIILGAKWLVRHSNASPIQQRRPLSPLLSLSFCYGSMVRAHQNAV